MKKKKLLLYINARLNIKHKKGDQVMQKS